VSDFDRQDFRLELSVLLRFRLGRLIVLLDVKSTQQHDGFFTEDASVDGIWRIDGWVGAESHNAAAAAESLVQTAKVDGADAVLTKGRGTHDAWFNRDVKVGRGQDREWILRDDLAEGDEFGMAGSLCVMLACIHRL